MTRYAQILNNVINKLKEGREGTCAWWVLDDLSLDVKSHEDFYDEKEMHYYLDLRLNEAEREEDETYRKALLDICPLLDEKMSAAVLEKQSGQLIDAGLFMKKLEHLYHNCSPEIKIGLFKAMTMLQKEPTCLDLTEIENKYGVLSKPILDEANENVLNGNSEEDLRLLFGDDEEEKEMD